MHNPILSLILALIHGITGLSILLVSSWFIAACAVAAPNFNYVLPAVAIRGFALLRISSGYGEMWLSHHQLLNKLAKLRLFLFNNLENSPANLRALETDKLNYQSQDLASVWVGWVHQNVSALLSLLIISVSVIILMPAFSNIWFAFVIGCILIYGYLMLSSISIAKQKLLLRPQLESDIEHHIDSAQIWHMQPTFTSPNYTSFYALEAKNKRQVALALSLFLLGSLIAVLFILHVGNKAVGLTSITPLYLVLPMALLASNDWLGRVFHTQDKLQDYVISKTELSRHKTTEITRINQKVKSLELKQFNASSTQPAVFQTVSLKIDSPNLTLLTGPSGSGKSRFMQAIAGLLPHKGLKLINHKEIVKQSLITDIIYVEQQPYCLSGTLRQNLQIANKDASDSMLRKHLVNLGLDYLSDLDEWLGTGGRILSGGELKRIGVIRALLSEQSFILLDEPFEALDDKNTELVVNAINELGHSKQVIIASHSTPSNLKVDFHISLDENEKSETSKNKQGQA